MQRPHLDDLMDLLCRVNLVVRIVWTAQAERVAHAQRACIVLQTALSPRSNHQQPCMQAHTTTALESPFLRVVCHPTCSRMPTESGCRMSLSTPIAFGRMEQNVAAGSRSRSARTASTAMTNSGLSATMAVRSHCPGAWPAHSLCASSHSKDSLAWQGLLCCSSPQQACVLHSQQGLCARA